MPSVTPDAAREWILSTLPGAWEDWPFGPGTRVFKSAKGKLFVLTRWVATQHQQSRSRAR